MKQPWLGKWGAGESLDRGGQGETFFVPNRANPKGVLKVLIEKNKLDLKARGRMSSEVTNLRILESVGAKVPQVLDANTEDISNLETECYFVMEFIPGQTLAKLVETRAAFGFEESVNVCLALTKTLRIIHEIPILHRDLKPENVMVRNLELFDIVMLDFGISFHGNDNPNLTTHNESFRNGLIHLPERTGVDAGKRDPRSDLTDVVAILYHCLTAQPPRNLEDEHGHPIHKTVQPKLKQKCSDETQLSKLNTFFSKGFQKNIDNRFQTVDELEKRLLELLSPGAFATDEDLKSSVNRSVDQLKNEKKTLIASFRKSIDEKIPDFERELDKLPLPVVVRNCPESLVNRNKQVQQFQLLKMDRMDRLAENMRTQNVYQLEVTNVNHNNIKFFIKYEFQLEGCECVIFRTILEPAGSSRRNILIRDLVERFSSPNEVSLDSLTSNVEAAVKICIQKITEKILLL